MEITEGIKTPHLCGTTHGRKWLLLSEDDEKPLLVHVDDDDTVVLPSTVVESAYVNVATGACGDVSSGVVITPENGGGRGNV